MVYHGLSVLLFLYVLLNSFSIYLSIYLYFYTFIHPSIYLSQYLNMKKMKT